VTSAKPDALSLKSGDGKASAFNIPPDAVTHVPDPKRGGPVREAQERDKSDELSM
jgi:hypothetical protein